jgi:hypothetical protein
MNVTISFEIINKYKDHIKCNILCSDRDNEIVEFISEAQLIIIYDNHFEVAKIEPCTIDFSHQQIELTKIYSIRKLTAYETILFDEQQLIQINNCFINSYYVLLGKKTYAMNIQSHTVESYIQLFDGSDDGNIFDRQISIDTYTGLDLDCDRFIIDPLIYFTSRNNIVMLKKDINMLLSKIKSINNEIKINKCKINIPILKDKCPICLEPFYKLTDKIITLGCGHTFCDCIKNCVNCLCPTCRKPFNMNSIGYNIALKEILQSDDYVVKYKNIISKTYEIKRLQTYVNQFSNIYDFKKTYINDDTFNKLASAISKVYGNSIKINEIQLNK